MAPVHDAKEKVVSHRVSELRAEDKLSVERLIGRTLNAEQSVLILTYRRGQPADVDQRVAARQRIVDSIAAIQQRAIQSGFSSKEADSVIDETMEHVRGRPGHKPNID